VGFARRGGGGGAIHKDGAMQPDTFFTKKKLGSKDVRNLQSNESGKKWELEPEGGKKNPAPPKRGGGARGGSISPTALG